MGLLIIAVVAIGMIAFVVWRYTSVARGGRARDEALLARLDHLLRNKGLA